MNPRRLLLALAVAALFGLTACDSGGESSAATPADTPTVSFKARYASPVEMVDKLASAGFEMRAADGGDVERQPAFNVFSAQYIAFFHGPAGESCYVGTFDRPSIGEELKGSRGGMATYVETAEGWYVSCASIATTNEVKAIIAAK